MNASPLFATLKSRPAASIGGFQIRKRCQKN